MEIIKREVALFNLNFIYNGKTVKVIQGNNILEERKCSGVREATKIMSKIEEEYHRACTGMC